MRIGVRAPAARSVFATSVAALALIVGATSVAAAPATRRVSVGIGGVEANGESSWPSLSGDGRYVVFQSSATNLVPDDTNGEWDVFLRDRKLGVTRRVSVGSGGQATGGSGSPTITPDGRFVVFASSASNLVPDDTNGHTDIFVRDRVNGTTRLVSVGAGGQTNSWSEQPDISADGRFIMFLSDATNLVPDDTNGVADVFVRDRKLKTTRRVSVGANGQANDESLTPAISANGRFVVWRTRATNLVPNDTNAALDVFVRDLMERTTRRVSVGAGGQADKGSFDPDISGSGRYVIFESDATNLIKSDTNDASDIFIRDRKLRTTRRVSVGASGQANHGSFIPEVSANGRYIAFESRATNLAGTDTNDVSDVYFRDVVGRRTRRVSLGPNGAQGYEHSAGQAISADGRFVAWTSESDTLVFDDYNGVRDVFIRGPMH